MPSKSRTRLVALSVAVAASATSAIVLTSPAHADTVHIHDIQGTTRISQYANQQVTDVPGIVTGVRAYGSSKGFWLQDPNPDNNPATSEGLFVFTSSTPTVAVGDSVTVTGTVSQYAPGGASYQTVTEITKPKVTVVSSGNKLPAPVVIDAKSVPAAYAPAGDPAAKNSINALPLQPSKYALDYYKSLEGMRVQVSDVRVVGPSNAYAEMWVTVKPGENPSPHGGTVYGSYDTPNTGRVQIQTLGDAADFPQANVGDSLAGTTTGPLDYNQFGGYTIVADELGTLKSGGLQRATAKKQTPGELSVATYNVENLDPSDNTFDEHAAAIVHNLQSPDIVSLEEIQDNNGAVDDGTVDASVTMKKLTDAIVAAGGPKYDWRSINPVNNQDGGEPGGNIRQVFLFNPERVSFTDRAGGDSTTAVGVTKVNGNKPALTVSPGRINPTSDAWKTSRKPLAGEFTFRGRTVFVIANHFASKGGDFDLTSQYQPAPRSSEVQRHLQAAEVNTFVKDILKIDKNADVVTLGDMNDFEFSDTAKILEGDGELWSAIKSLPKNERYTYNYNGNEQVLDQILISPALKRGGNFEYESVHINSEFHDQISDHDPQLIRLHP
ncbi:endonuclease/exonuclease/phosphatase family protein [Streptomyces cyslabdanicus]|uniref:endonuclease/exonuclease/phosphatase family protein n=1 Tax=Streptomyces cyslabdanicus TaxID=1470456 RepID=UPI004044BF42